MYLEVALRIGGENLYTYRVKEEFEPFCEIGKRVLIPFRNRETTGWIIKILERCDYPEGKIKDIIAILDDEPLIDGPLIKLFHWIKEYYLTSFVDAISCFIPPNLSFKKLKKIDIELKTKEPVVNAKEHLFPNEEQEYAISRISSALSDGKFNVFLLYGITGSGKTEVYLQVIQKAIANGGSAIVLVPEISLTPQIITRFKERFGENIALIHSRLTAKQRFIEWQRIRKKMASIVVGARSALFAPAKALKLIIVDEEQSTSYKQENNPRYNARDLSIMRAKIENCVCILGSATPSLESFYNAQNNKFSLLSLSKRIEKRPLPIVEIVDMRQEKKGVIFSEHLSRAISSTLEKNGQIILLLNRRGYSNFLQCYECGFIPGCPNCDITLTYHIADKTLKCHYCGYRKSAFSICPRCKGERLKFSGFGTQRIENELKSLFPHRKILRMDIDTTKKRGSHEEILKMFERQEADILLGTQMISKGLDFPNVLLVGVVSSDISLFFPDFRAAEKTFSLLTQVAGRSGRGKMEGRSIIQTYNPGHYAIQTAIKQDYSLFYKEEITYRKELSYPPFTRLLSITILSEDEKKASDSANSLFTFLSSNNNDDIVILGPAPYFIPKIKRQYRFQILLKSKNYKKMQNLLLMSLTNFKLPSDVSIIKDMDPVGIV